MTLVGSIPAGQKIYFNDVKDQRNELWCTDKPSAATMQFAVNSDALRDPIRRRILHDSLLGGFSNVDDKKHTPFKHPYAPGLYAKDVVNIEPKASNTRPSGGAPNFLEYSVDYITVNFESRTYPVALAYSQGDDWNPNFVDVELRPSSVRTQAPLGWFVFTTGSFINRSSLLGNFKSMPAATLVLTIHQVKFDWVFTGGSGSLYPFFMPFFGQVNTQSFAGWGAEKLLLDGGEYRPYFNMMGERLCDIRLVFACSDWGWNKSVDSGGSVESIRFIGGGDVRPFPTFGLSTMIAALNPK